MPSRRAHPLVAVATCRDYPLAETADAPLLRALGDLGAETAHPIWNDPAVDWGSFDLCLVRSTWDWQHDPTGFTRWLTTVAAATTLVNPIGLLLWGCDKRYLVDLEAAGVPVVPSILARKEDRSSVPGLVRARGWSRVVVKPVLGADAHGTTLLDAHDAGSAAWEEALEAAGDVALVQAFVPSVVELGEVSVVAIGGEIAHAVRKRPAPGDFRVQSRFGGTSARIPVEPEERRAAQACLRALPEPAAYTRIDLVRDQVGEPRVMECEVVEPELFLDLNPAAAVALATRVLAQLATW